MKLRLVMLLALLAGAFVAHAGGLRSDVRKTAEKSMLVTGTIDIGTDGVPFGHRLDQPEQLPDFVRKFVSEAVTFMRFVPVQVDGKVVNARAKMGVLVVARQLDNGNYQLRVGSASFGDDGPEDQRVIKSMLTPPSYPTAAFTSNISGTTYVVVKIGRQGTVEDVAVEQTNLTSLGNELQMQRGRRLLERAVIAAAREWQFKIPTQGETADDPFWSVRVPVDFEIERGPARENDYGIWHTYIPGPKQHVPWISEEENRQSPEALVAGGVYQVGRGPRLIKPLGEG